MNKPRLSEQAFRVLRRLRGLYSERNPFVSADWLATDCQMPLPSLRRSVRELRQADLLVIHENKQVGLVELGSRFSVVAYERIRQVSA
jgi:RIO-like serine/threonine protein kinase